MDKKWIENELKRVDDTGIIEKEFIENLRDIFLRKNGEPPIGVINRLSEGFPILPIEDLPEKWIISGVDKEVSTFYYHMDYPKLLKKRFEDGKELFNDTGIDPFFKFMNEKGQNVEANSYFLEIIKDMYYPIKFPYYPKSKNYYGTIIYETIEFKDVIYYMLWGFMGSHGDKHTISFPFKLKPGFTMQNITIKEFMDIKSCMPDLNFA